ATLDLAIRQDGANRGGPGQRGKAIHKYVVPDQQRVLHGPRGNFKCLYDKSNDEKSGDEHACNSGNRLRKTFLFLFRFPVFVFSEQTNFLDRIYDQRTSRNIRSQRASWNRWAICPECKSLSLEPPGSDPLTDR